MLLMVKKKKPRIKLNILEKILFLSVFVLVILSLWFFFIQLGSIFWYIIWLTYIVATIFVWQRILRATRLGRIKIQGRPFEMFFFMFIFMSSYIASYILIRFMWEVSLIIFVVSTISAGYSGYMHFIEGWFNKDYRRKKSK